MQYNDLRVTYPAELRTLDDKLVEIGEAVIQFESQSVDFNSEFVQLFKMDTPLKIVAIVDGVEVQSFTGKVYLSSKSMLRLVNVSDVILPDAYLVYQCDVKLTGTVIATITHLVKKGRFSNAMKAVTQLESFPVDVNRVSMKTIDFTSEKMMEKGQSIKLSTANPPLNCIDLEIEKVFEFGENSKNYRCQIIGMHEHSLKNLEIFISQMCEERLKLF